MSDHGKKLTRLRQGMAKGAAKKAVKESSDATISDNGDIRDYMLTKTVMFSANQSHTFNMVEELAIDLNQIDNEMQKQASTYGFLSVSAEVAMKRAEALKVAAEKVSAQRYFELKKGDFVKAFPGVKMTEDGIKAALVLDAEVVAAQEVYQDALHNAKVLQRYTMSLIQKKDMLQSLNSSMNKDRT